MAVASAVFLLCAGPGCSHLSLTTELQPDHIAAFAVAQKVRFVVRTPDTRVVSTPPDALRLEEIWRWSNTVFSAERLLRNRDIVVQRVQLRTGRSLVVSGSDSVKSLRVDEPGFREAWERINRETPTQVIRWHPGPGNQAFFATRFLRGLGIALAGEKDHADATIELLSYFYKTGSRHAQYTSSIVVNCANLNPVSSEMIGDVRTTDDLFPPENVGFTNAVPPSIRGYGREFVDVDKLPEPPRIRGFYRLFGQFFEQLSGKERTANAWSAILHDPILEDLMKKDQVEHEPMLNDAVDALAELARAGNASAIAALRKAQLHSSPEVRQKAADTLTRLNAPPNKT